jgi:hypothetical protein
MRKTLALMVMVLFLAALAPVKGEGTLYALDSYQKQGAAEGKKVLVCKYNANGEHTAIEGPLNLAHGGTIDHINWWSSCEEAGFWLQDDKGAVLRFKNGEEAKGRALIPGKWSAYPNLPQGMKETHLTVWVRAK